jgi:2-hydroxyglutaryl-CoA dehydratase, D-component
MSETRSVTTLQAARDAGAFQRVWFAELRERVAAGAPLAVVNADAPHELFRAFDVPYVVNQWWASVVAAKQKSAPYLAALRERGYPDWSDQYGSLALASSLADDDDPPWGGLPRPTFLVAHLTDDAQRKIFELWARETGAVFQPLSATVANEVPPTWHDTIQHDWERVIGTERLDLMVEELRGLIEVIEHTTGRRFQEERLAEVMRLANEQAEWNRRTRDLIARTSPAPVSVADVIPAVMLPQWHRGTQYAVAAAQALHDEVAARVERGEGPDERVRLMWVGRGLWFNMGFYQHFEKRYGAVFVWSMYLAVAADAYLRYGDDALRTLAARFAAFGDQINMPPWSSEWYLKEARHNRIDGVVHLVGDALRGAPFITRALEEAGIPVCEIDAHNVDQRAWDDDAIKARVSHFIESRVL